MAEDNDKHKKNNAVNQSRKKLFLKNRKVVY